MKLRMQLCFVILLCVVQSYAQNQKVRVTTQNVNGNIVFDASVDGLGSHTLVLEFTELQGYDSPHGNIKFINLTSKSNSAIYTLKKNESSSSYSYRYTYRYNLGSIKNKQDEKYPYLLPGKEGDELRTSKVRNIEHRLGKAHSDSVLGVSFVYQNEIDTVFAMRSGYVVDVVDSERKRKTVNDAYLTYDKPSQNVTIVEHKDGTLAYYTCVTDGVNLLKPGDRVVAGQPIAVLKRAQEANRLVVKICYLGQDLKHVHIRPYFYTDMGVKQLEYNEKYKSCINQDLIVKELSKKEKKKMK